MRKMKITKSKPDPEVFLKAAEYLKVEPSECYVVEDACAGIDAAQAAGMKTIGMEEAKEYHSIGVLKTMI